MEITKAALGLVAGVGIVAGAAGAFVATHVGTPGAGRATCRRSRGTP